jgi:hypothetical protein
MKPTATFEIPKEEDLNTQAYLLECEHWKDHTGHEFCAEYAYGTGILSATTVATHRAHWVRFDRETKVWSKQKSKEKHNIFEPLLKFFAGDARMAKITMISIEEAEKILERIRLNPRSFLPEAEKPVEVKEEKAEKKEDKKEPLPHEKKEEKKKDKK